jgi:tRNA(Ile)-lysidine synthase
MPRCDPTNQDVRFARNRLRREVVPQLLKINPRLGVSLDRLGRIASDGEAFFEAELDRHIATWVEVCPTCWTLDRSHWVILHPSLKRGLLRRASLTLVPGSDVGADAIESAVVACDRWPAGKRVTWTDYREVAIEHTSIEIRLMSETVRPPASFDFDLTGTGKVDLTKIGWLTWLRVARGSDRVDDWPVLHYQHVTSVCRDRTYDRWHADLDRAALGKPPWVSVRSRRPGDWLAPAGMTGRKKIHDILVDAYIPGRLRDHVPIIESPNGIAWLVGLRRDRRFLASDACSDVICVEVVSSFRGQLKP